MKIDQSGHLDQARYIASPNYNERPQGEKVSLIVIHNISLPAGQFGGSDVESLFTNRLNCSQHESYQDLAELRVSSHFFIRRDGKIIQFVPVNKRAWHAGVSSYLGRENCNDFSVGIELEGTDDLAYEQVQYHVLVELCQALIDALPELSPEHISGHEHIAPGRKTDPGPSFDWAHFNRLLQEGLALEGQNVERVK
ncbi:1,6-anhydro-N-acetylmuramyl-L-alanine amidase AmpD [Piscirickettsia litoralis]|uniref:1,6-anhydro-N-acetylmuramyl-L-alanine amidase AmpD n=1 Tax=Piscirickettsia litoralis TaxID=1891921 RepID=A0ABX3A5F4_9GAMM|nr:1,6-anhydro-N-acetylmuramyl-L-alanine amidase AmpD [Piscirickettsia litoralis]ODN42906.1 N-acetyl-anhydromuranmyl-L-alanine amidase [Piscirickettsia litoralis]